MKRAEIGGITVQMIYSMVCLDLKYSDLVVKTEKPKMFPITHDKHLVYSLIKVRKLTRPLLQGEQLIRDLMLLWANETAIPYLNWMTMFKTDDIV